MCRRKIFWIIIPLLIMSSVVFAQPATGSQNLVLQYKPYYIDLSSLWEFCDTLPPDQQEEQLRDWAFYGLLVSLNVEPSAIKILTGTDHPMRYAGLKGKFNFLVQPGRIVRLEDKNCVMLIPEQEAENRLLQGALFDRSGIGYDKAVKNISIFSYSVDRQKRSVTTSFVRDVPVGLLKSVDYGYFEREISDAAGLKDILKDLSDVIFVKLKKNSVVLAGRRNRHGADASLSIEDVAVLHQAYFDRKTSVHEAERRKSYDQFLSRKYAEIIRKDKKLRQAIKAGKIKYLNIMTKLRKAYPYVSLDDMDANVGFSLDPLYDNKSIAEEIFNLSIKKGRFSGIPTDNPVFKAIDKYAVMMSSVSAKVRAGKDISPLLKFRRKLAVSKDAGERQLDLALQDIEMQNTFQTARYDGRIKGTNAAMILFYTDLAAKLWALDYNGMAPKNAILGFRNLTEIQVPKFYWDDFVRFSKTRLWFGLRNDSFDICGDEITFEPIAARVYSASSDPLYPGKESKTNYQSGEFLGWWDEHYASVADYEPYYYKLNQLLKWSCIMMVLKEKNPNCMDYLAEVPVSRNLDFEGWYNNHPGLKAGTNLPFIDSRRFNGTTECFKMLRSKGYPLMGATFTISGGVSLASKRDIAAKIAKGRGGKKKKYSGINPSAKSITVAGKKYAKIADNNKGNGKPGVIIQKKSDFGDFRAEVEKQVVKLHWEKNEGAILDEYVNGLVNTQMASKPEDRGEVIFRKTKDARKAVRIEAGKIYLVQSGLLKDKWIYIAVDPQGRPAGFKAMAAGTEADSSIFYAKTVSSIEAVELIKRNTGVILFEN